MKSREVLRNTMGAFSDGAILFPLLVLLSQTQGFSTGKALFTTGVMYLIAAWVFRVPMSVQPLKSIAVASIAVGASFTEIRLSGLLLGLVCIGMAFLDVNRIARKIPEAIIHQLQAALGVLLILQGAHAGFGYETLALTALMVLLPEFKGVPILGLVATGGLLFALFQTQATSPLQVGVSESLIRPGLILTLLIPQLVLTSANSVLATRNVCERYFGAERSARVTIRRLLFSIGLGNSAVALFGGMPFCHGSGGITAHVRGGSTHAGSTALMGGVLVLLSALYFFRGSQSVVYPPLLISSLLMASGFFHLKLAAPTFKARYGWVKLGVALLLTIATRNLLWALGAAVVFEVLSTRLMTKEVQA